MLTHQSFLLTGSAHGRPFEADATYRADGRAKPVLLFVHGFKGFKDWGHFPLLAAFFAGRGFVFVKLNLSHNGVVVGGTGDLEDLEAFGRNNFSIELDDIGQVIGALFSPGATPVPAAEVDLSRFFLAGHSRGGGLALLKAAEDPRVRALAPGQPLPKCTRSGRKRCSTNGRAPACCTCLTPAPASSYPCITSW